MQESKKIKKQENQIAPPTETNIDSPSKSPKDQQLVLDALAIIKRLPVAQNESRGS